MRSVVFLQTLFHLAICIEAKKAFLEIILYEINQEDGRYLIRKREINGIFSNFGTVNRAEGDIIQVHPHTLCASSSDAETIEYGWVGVVKLPFDASSCHAADKARSAVKKGATAVIFDITDHPGALQMLNEHSFNGLNQPIVLVKGGDASKLMDIIQREQIARAVIKRGEPNQDSFGGGLRDPALLLSGLIFVCSVVAFIFCRTKCKKRKQQRSLHNWMLHHSKMKKYQKQQQIVNEFESNMIRCYQSSVSSGSLCAICLDTFTFGEDLRVLECQHEFHLNCIDLWLQQKRSCPLCNRSFSGFGRENDRLLQTSLNADSDNWHSIQSEPNRQDVIADVNDLLEVDTSPQSREPTHEFTEYLTSHCDSSSQGDSPSADEWSWRGGSSHIDHGRNISPWMTDSCASRLDTHDTNRTRDKLRTSVSLQEKHKNSYYLRVEGYPVPHVLNEDCESISFPSQHLGSIKNVAAIKSCPSENGRSSIDNMSVLAHLGSTPAIGGRRSSPLSSDTWNQVDYLSDSSEARSRQSTNRHRLTPCIEYSSSDITGNLHCQSYSTLEDALVGVTAE